MHISQKIKNTLHESLQGHDISRDDIHLEHPSDISHGDYATNIAFMHAKKAGKNPREFADECVTLLEKNKLEYIDRYEVAGPGFINIFLSADYFHSEVDHIISSSENYGRIQNYQGKKVVIEHSSPNLLKPFHIGHLMNNAIGESLVRAAKYAGGEVIALSYPSDISLGIGKAIWYLMEKAGGIEALENLQSLDEQITFLGDCYVQGTRIFKDDESTHADIKELTKELFEGQDTPAFRAYTKVKELNIKYFTKMVQRIGSTFDDFIFESEAGIRGAQLIHDHTPSVFHKSNGAHIYEGERDGLHTRVFINAEGYPTYEAKDIGLLSLKFERFDPDISILITDHEQREYYKVVLAAARNIESSWADNSVHVTHGRMTLRGEKMSSRLGGVPTALSLIETVRAEITERNSELSEKSYDSIALAALKFTILKTQAGKNINFDPDTSLSFEGDSGPYIQYTYARLQSLLKKGKDMNIAPDAQGEPSEITSIERMLYRFSEALELVILDHSPHHMAHYALDLAHEVNSWYGNTKVLLDDNVYAPYQLALARAAAIILDKAMYIMGIESLDEM